MDPKCFKEAYASAIANRKPMAPLTAQLEAPFIPYELLTVITD